MNFLLLKQKLLASLKKPITKKSAIAFMIVSSLFFTFQNCSETKFKEIQLASQSVTELNACSLDDLTSNSLMMSTTGFTFIGSPPSQMTNIPMGSTVYIWMNNFPILESADWFMSYNSGTEVSMGSGDRLMYPSAQGAEQGLLPGSYRIRINLKKVCENVASDSGTISKAEIAASSTIEKDLIVQFVVTDPNASVCPMLDNLLLAADDPKTQNTNVNFTIALPTMCRPQATYWFGDGENSKFVGGSSAVHKYERAGQYSSSAQVTLLDFTSRKKSLYKPVIINSECPKLENVFLSGPSLVYAGQAASFQLQNFLNQTCNLNVKKVVFKKDGTALNPIESSPFKQALSWQAAEISNSNDGNQVIADVYLNDSPKTDGSPDLSLSKYVRVVAASNQCAIDALNSVFISGPRTAKINATLTHTINVPTCLRESNFESTSIEWALVKPDPNNSEGLLENKAPGASLTSLYPLAGNYTVKATIKNTKFGQLKISQDVRIESDGSEPPPPPPPNVCTNGATNYAACDICPEGKSLDSNKQCVDNSCVSAKPACSSSSPAGCTLIEKPTAINQAWQLNAASCGYSCNVGYTGPNCQTCSNGSIYPGCTNCPAGQSMNASGQCVANNCSPTKPACSSTSPVACTLIENPSSLNQAWQLNALSCGYSCKPGYTGASCNVCANGANYPACTTCPSGQSMNASGQCVANNCSTSKPACSTSSPAGCSLVENPTSLNQAWQLNAQSCGFSCKPGYTGPNCQTCSNGSSYPGCTNCPAGQSMNASGQCVANNCSTTKPACSSTSPVACTLVENPTSLNQAWQLNAQSCGFSCKPGYTGVSCNACSNGANYPACTTCPSGQSMNSSGQCVANNCSTSKPACSSTSPSACTLVENPTSLNQAWQLNAQSCGFSCKPGYTGATCNACSNGSTYPACTTCPSGQSMNASGQCVNNSCSTSTPACAASNSCTLTYNPSSINEAWMKDDLSCGFSCKPGYTGASCNVCANGANYPACTTCPTGQSMNSSGQCVTNSCSTSTPACAASNSCSLTYNPVSINEAWVKDDTSCGFSCKPGYTGAACNVCANGATYPSCSTCPQGQSFNSAGQCAPNSCSPSTPGCASANSCSLTYNPVSVNEAWVKNDSSCGFSCKPGYTGAACTVCTNGANYPGCSACPQGQSFNGAGQCVDNSCSASTPGCASANTCSLTYNPSSINEPWVLNDSSCGFSCKPGYTGAACNVCANGATYPGCSACPTGQSFNSAGQCIANSCSSSLPACAGQNLCSLTYSPSSINQGWSINSNSCGFTCTNGAVNVNGQCVKIYCEPRTEQNNSSLCQVVTKCAESGHVLSSQMNVSVPMAVDIRGEPNTPYVIGRSNVSTSHGEITLWNQDPSGNTHNLTQYCNSSGAWSQTQDGWCQVTKTVAETTAGCPGDVPNTWLRISCAQMSCEYDGQFYDNSTSCCYDTYYCGYGGRGTCRFRNGQWYIENFTCGGFRSTPLKTQCK